MKNKVFISYSSADYRNRVTGEIIPGNVISIIIETFKRNAIDFWIDENGLVSSRGWCKQIRDAIDSCNIFLFVSSKNSNLSPNTANEIQYALDKGLLIVPLRLDDSRYHEDIELNLIRIHYLRYFQDANKAIDDLITTIQTGIIQSGVTSLYPSSSQTKAVLSVFNSNDIVKSAAALSDLLNSFDCVKDEGYKVLLAYIKQLQVASEERNYNIRRSRIENLIKKVKDESCTMNRIVQVIKECLLMYLYFYIGDVSEVLLIQKRVGEISYELTFIERNAGTINEVANGTIRTGVFVLSVLAMLSGRGSIGRAGVYSSTRGDQYNVVSTPQQIAKNKCDFDDLKSALLNLHFNC